MLEVYQQRLSSTCGYFHEFTRALLQTLIFFLLEYRRVRNTTWETEGFCRINGESELNFLPWIIQED